MKLNLKRLRPNRPGWQVGASLAFIAVGFVAIAKAWDGAASVDFAQGQIPYLISGGAAGLALIIIGVALMMFEMGRRDRLHLDARLDSLTKAIETLAAANGNGSGPSSAKAAAEASANGLFVAGASSYHRPDCRLVTGKDKQEFLSLDEVAERGLAPCRVCSPQVAETAGR